MTPESIPDPWRVVIDQANDLDPAIREALRPVFDRLKSEAPNTAAAMSLAMICRALRMLRSTDGNSASQYQAAICRLALMEVTNHPDHP